MHGGGDAGLFQLFLQGFAVRDLDGVLGPGAGVVGFNIGCLDGGHGLPRFARNDGRKQAVVGVGHALTLGQFFVQHGQFGQQDGRLQGVQAAVHAHAHMVVAAVLAVAGNLAHDFGQFVVVRENRPAVAVAAQGFAGEEARTGNGRQVAAFAAFVGGPKALGGVFNDGDAVFGCDGVDGVKVGALAVQAHGHDGFCSRGDGRL